MPSHPGVGLSHGCRVYSSSSRCRKHRC
jgi:hypothetical protein